MGRSTVNLAGKGVAIQVMPYPEPDPEKRLILRIRRSGPNLFNSHAKRGSRGKRSNVPVVTEMCVFKDESSRRLMLELVRIRSAQGCPLATSLQRVLEATRTG